MAEHFSNRDSLMDAATVLAARRAIDREIAHLVADPFDRQAADRLQHAVSAHADRAQEALERLVRLSRWPNPSDPPEVQAVQSTDIAPADVTAPLNPRRTDTGLEEQQP